MHRSLTEFHRIQLNGLWRTWKYQFIALCKVDYFMDEYDWKSKFSFCVGYFKTPTVSSPNSVNSMLIDELQWIWKEDVLSRLNCHPGIFLEELRRPMKNLSEDSPCPSQDPNRVPVGKESMAFPLSQPVLSATFLTLVSQQVYELIQNDLWNVILYTKCKVASALAPFLSVWSHSQSST